MLATSIAPEKASSTKPASLGENTASPVATRPIAATSSSAEIDFATTAAMRAMISHARKMCIRDRTEAVRIAISQLGYQPNRSARALVTRRTGVVAVIVPEADERVFSDPFFPQAYHGALMGFRDSDVQVVLAMAQPGDNASRMVRYLESGHIDGAIIVSHHGPALARALAQTSQPIVFVGDPETPGVCYVDVDQATAAFTATQHLIEKGARRIGTITGPLDMAAAVQRLQGFERAMQAAGLDASVRSGGDFTRLGGRNAAARLLTDVPDLDGLFVANDLMASGAISELSRAGRTVPDDVLVVGFDDSIAALECPPPLLSLIHI